MLEPSAHALQPFQSVIGLGVAWAEPLAVPLQSGWGG